MSFESIDQNSGGEAFTGSNFGAKSFQNYTIEIEFSGPEKFKIISLMTC